LTVFSKPHTCSADVKIVTGIV